MGRSEHGFSHGEDIPRNPKSFARCISDFVPLHVFIARKSWLIEARRDLLNYLSVKEQESWSPANLDLNSNSGICDLKQITYFFFFLVLPQRVRDVD